MAFNDRPLFPTAAAALLSLPLVAGSAIAQQSDTQSGTNQTQSNQAETNQAQTDQTQTDQTQSNQGGATGSGGGMSGAGQPGTEQDTLIATVGSEEIRASDVMTVIGMLPPQLASQPPELLVPMAMEQLILRELILQQARSQNLAEDSEVRALVEGSMQGAEEDAMVQVWIDREMEGTVTDEAVQQAYTDLQSTSQQELPPLEQIRPQIEQHLRQLGMQEIAARLQQGADIVLFDAAGQPIERPQNGGGQGGSGTSGSGDASQGNSDSGSGSGGTSSGN
ncbi:hypothetical protein [Jannaschia formosa]|uniref:hypothetical protein n=1 Tax=Jannaschia formosa TaxID=2259592 RepID=UPI001ADDC7E2|nr:hypothetical protein [Jannaschia formosa]